ncbi:MAG TPA: two-component regulator propeller domain-containing protein, partial [Chitinophagaceae bacterium]|nr:two-component regulator propeller domain-containing protein [Chitinophagaceae bacterium]
MKLEKLQMLKFIRLKITFLLAILSFFTLPHPAFSQSKYLVENFWVENYTKKQGLPEDIIIDILQDSKGYMWMTTPYSLVRFDGYEFKSFSPRRDFPDLYVHFFTGLIEDSRGLLWMCTFDKGLFCFDPRTGHFTRYSADDKSHPTNSNTMVGIVEDKFHRIWSGSEKGLNCIDGFDSKITVHIYNKPDTVQLIKSLETVFSHHQPLISFSKIGDYESKEDWVSIKDTARIMIICMGEEFSLPADYGWLEDAAGKKIWQVEDARSVAAGGDIKNRLQVTILKLQPGKYKLSYRSDESHSWNKWNARPPMKPDWWGVHIFQLPAKLTDSINIVNERVIYKQGTRGEGIKTLLKDSNNDLWALTTLGLEKLVLPEKKENALTSRKFALPVIFGPGYSIQQFTRDSILIEGSFFDSLSNRNYSGQVQINMNDGKYRGLYDGDINFAGGNSRSYARDIKGNYWKGTFNNTGDGLYTWNENDYLSGFHRMDITPPALKKNGQLAYEQIWTVYPDRSGSVWVGSRQNALYKIKLNRSPINYVSIPSLLNENKDVKFDWIETDAAGNIWLLSKTDGIYLYKSKDQKVTHFPKTKDPAYTLFSDPRDHSIMTMSGRQIKKYSPSETAFKTMPVNVRDSLDVIASDWDGNLWGEFYNTNDPRRGIGYYDGKQFQYAGFDSSKFATNFYRDISWGKNGNVWISPAFEGVNQYKLDNNTKQLRFVKKFLPEGVDVYDIYEDDKGIIWAGTYDDGLIRLDPSSNSYKAFTRKDGLPSNFISKIIPAGKQIWVITDQGSAFVDRATSNIRINKELNDYVFLQTDGSLFNAFLYRWYYPKAVSTPSGDIAFITNNGFCYFNPNDLRADSTKPVLQITGLKIGKQNFVNGTWLDKNNFRLRHSQNDIEINFIGLQYDEPSQNKYAYYLKGSNDDWVEAGTEKTVRFSNLAPGRYEFYLKASNADGVWTEPQKMFSFRILPPWWKTWWAYLIYILLLVLGIGTYIRYRSRQLHRENVLLEEKVKQRTNELSASLEELKMTQGQLVQREKMASLG